MLNFINPWVIVTALVVFMGAGAFGFKLGGSYQIAKAAEQTELIRAAADAVAARTAEQIGKIQPIHKTIQTGIKETVRENVVYRDCVVDPATERLLDAARANREIEPGSSSGVSP